MVFTCMVRDIIVFTKLFLLLYYIVLVYPYFFFFFSMKILYIFLAFYYKNHGLLLGTSVNDCYLLLSTFTPKTKGSISPLNYS